MKHFMFVSIGYALIKQNSVFSGGIFYYLCYNKTFGKHLSFYFMLIIIHIIMRICILILICIIIHIQLIYLKFHTHKGTAFLYLLVRGHKSLFDPFIKEFFYDLSVPDKILA